MIEKRKNGLVTLLLVALFAPLAFTLQGCTDLDEETFGVITADQFFQTDEEIVAALAPVYAQLRVLQWNYFNVSEVTTDNAIVPVRGTDWGDNGRWQQLHQHTWDASHVDIAGAWVDSFTGIARANTVLAQLVNATGDVSAVEAELRFLRAYYYYTLLDLYGGVPIVTDAATDPDNPPSRNSNVEVFNFIVDEMTAARANLADSWDAANSGRATKGAADAVLTRLFLNAQTYTGTVSAGGLQPGQARWNDVIEAADRVINSGNYSLTSDYFDSFRVNNATSPEVIMFAGMGNTRDEWLFGLNLISRTSHYNMLPESPWNGFSTLAETFQAYEDGDRRKDMFLIGPIYSAPNQSCVGNECFSDASSGLLQDRNGNDLIFTEDFLTPAGVDQISTPFPVNTNETSGVRIYKYEVDGGRPGGQAHGNEFVLFRLSDVMLAKAEAHNESGIAGALGIVNQIRNRAGLPDASCSGQADCRELIMAERHRELLYEISRRQDLIRSGGYTDAGSAWSWKANNDGFRVLHPVPQLQIDANPNLTQNPGY